VARLARPGRRPFVRSALAALALTASGAAAIGTAQSPAHAADGDPVVNLLGKDKMHLTTYRGQAYTNFGLQLQVSGAPLVIWSQRPSYDDQVVVTEKLASGDRIFPEGVTDHIGNLDDFVTATFVPSGTTAGKQFTRKMDGCLSAADRLVPSAVLRSPYPDGCYYNPYAIGAVQGIPAGWSGHVLGNGYDHPLHIKPGTYTATFVVSPEYADTLGLSEDNRTVTSTVIVKKGGGGDCRRGCRTPNPGTARVQRGDQPEPKRPTGEGITSATDLPDGTPVPDMRALPAFGISLNKAGTQLRFGATVWDGGTSDMVVDGFRREGEDVMDAYQYFLDGDGNVIDYAQVGTMEWDPDPTHHHWHFKDFATYSLVGEDESTVAVSGKESFCLANTDAVDMTGDGAKMTINYDDLGSSCGGHGAQSIRESLAAGWGDTYVQYRAGQSLPIKNVPDGTYFIKVQANPEGNLIESDTTNNSSLREIHLSTNAKGVRKLKVDQVGIVDDEGYFNY
jgi:hypothetical protein